jgi:hypothetical protein
MVLRLTILAFILATTPAMAKDLSPWFGSQASEATQVSLSALSESGQPATNSASASAEKVCPIEGCSETSKPVKYNN